MPKRIPVAAAKRLADEQKCSQVIVVAWDGEKMHVVTYGKTREDCAQAARGGNAVKRALGFPDGKCHDSPARGREERYRLKPGRRASANNVGSAPFFEEIGPTFIVDWSFGGPNAAEGDRYYAAEDAHGRRAFVQRDDVEVAP